MSASSTSAPTAAPTATNATNAIAQIAVNAASPTTATSLRQIAVGLYGQRPDSVGPNSMGPICTIGRPNRAWPIKGAWHAVRL